MIVGLRHDVDTVYGLRWGLPKIIYIEKKYDVRSTFFVRVDVVRSDKDLRVLKGIADEGWEIGLHLMNTVNDSRLLSSEGELKVVKKTFRCSDLWCDSLRVNYRFKATLHGGL
jgi:hypothetical protein